MAETISVLGVLCVRGFDIYSQSSLPKQNPAVSSYDSRPLISKPDLLQTIVAKGVSNHELGDAVGTSVCENELNLSVSELKGKASVDARNLDYEMCLGVLNKVLEVGFKRLKSDLIESDTNVGESVEIEEGEMMCLREVILEHGDIFEALCENIAKQVKWNEGGDDDLGNSPSVKEESRDEDVEVFKMIQRCIQTVHLDAMKESLKERDGDRALSHIQFLQFDCGVDEADYMYRKVLYLLRLLFKTHTHTYSQIIKKRELGFDFLGRIQTLLRRTFRHQGDAKIRTNEETNVLTC
nr:hypothetical protein [Tanacetum cinerariifolium]